MFFLPVPPRILLDLRFLSVSTLDDERGTRETNSGVFEGEGDI